MFSLKLGFIPVNTLYFILMVPLNTPNSIDFWGVGGVAGVLALFKLFNLINSKLMTHDVSYKGMVLFWIGVLKRVVQMWCQKET